MKRIIIAGLACLMVAAAAAAQTAHQHGMMGSSMNHDQMFADMMANHHQDGIKMAKMAVDKAENAELRSMAQTMIDDQTREIDQLKSLRGEGPAMSMDEMMKMPGMMPESEMHRDMARLESASGHDFDVAFTEIMAKHHEGAIRMAKHELEMGSNPGLKELAQTIADKQSRERDRLLAMNRDMTSASATRERMTKE
jgi:uncharacterized protein (DUF305 family)